MRAEIRVEAVAITSWARKRKTEEVIAGRSFEECDPFGGEHRAHTFSWKGQADLGHAENQLLYLRFKLRVAKLFSFTPTHS